jgi:hypothetical protein
MYVVFVPAMLIKREEVEAETPRNPKTVFIFLPICKMHPFHRIGGIW